jgi:hypothetical protein
VDCLSLLEHGADCNYKMPLKYCINFDYYQDDQKMKNLGHLLRYKADIFVTYNYKRKSTSFIRELVRKPAQTIIKIQSMIYEVENIDLNLKDQHGYNYLLYLCENYRYAWPRDVLEPALLIHKLDLNVQNPKGDSPLHLLIKRREYGCAKLLIERDVSFLHNNEGKTALYYLLTLLQVGYDLKSKKELVELCLQKGADLNEIPTFSEAHSNYLEVKNFIDEMIEKYPPFDVKLAIDN